MISFDLNKLQGDIAQHNKAVPPVESWNPPFCGDIDLAIKHDGSWHYMGTPIGRIALVKLFASVLKREADNYFLVTPVEKVGIQVADCPFLITQWQQKDNNFIFTTNLDDTFVVSRDNPIELMSDKVTGDLLPYALVRRNLWARLHQNVFYQLVEAGLEKMIDAEPHLIISSAGQEFSLGKYV
jgi:hypothetical protein